jgi:hypothetical protein
MIAACLRRGVATVVALALIAATRFPSLSQAQPAAVPIASPSPSASASPAAATPTASPAPSLTYGDLQHLTYTATGSLTVAFVDPQKDASSPISAIAATVRTVSGAGVELLINGKIVPTRQLGKRTVDTKTGETRYYYYGIPLEPGPNTLSAVPIGADDVHGQATSITVYGPGDPASIQTAFEQHLIADGKSVAPLDISINDRWGHPAMPGQRLKVTIVRGDATFVDLPSVAQPSPEPGQMPATPAPSDYSSSDPGVGRIYSGPTSPGSFTRILLVGGMVAGTLELEIRVGDVQISRTFYIDPYVRDAFVNGLITVGAGSMPASVDGDAIDDGGGARRLRGALYASGKVGKDSLLTTVYESQNRLTQLSSLGPYTQDPGERPYQTYGDSSQQNSEDHSNDHLYARLDHGRNNLLWGQYTATLGNDQVGAYTQFLSGLKGELELGKNKNAHVMGFTARNNLAYVQQIISPNGLSSQQMNQPLQPDIVVDSDNILLTVLDRRTGQIISQTPLIRNVDYSIDYATGILRFINIPLPFDSLGNPQVIVVQYQYQGPGVKSETTGGSYELDLGSGDSKGALQLGYVNDASGGQNFSMFSQSLGKAWSNGSWSIAHADSTGTIPLPGVTSTALGSSGQALSAHLNIHSGFNALSFEADKSSAGYNDPFGGLSTPGLGNYQAQWVRVVPKKSALTLSYDAQTDNYQAQNNSERDLTASYQWFLKKLTILTGLVDHQQRIGVTATATPVPGTSATPVPLLTGNSLLAHASATYQMSKRLSLGVDEYLTLSGNQLGSTQPTQTLAQFNYMFPEKGTLFVRELWSATPQATFANSVSSLTTGVAATHTTDIGFARPLSPSTTVTTEYNIDQTGSATDIYSTMGVNQTFKFNSKFGGNLFVQAANSQGGAQSGFTVFGLTLGYANDQKMRTTFSYQDRSGGGGGSTASLGLAGHLSPQISMVGTLQRAYGNGLSAIDDQVSLAYRPVYSDRWTSLLNYTRSNGSDATSGIGSVVTWEELFRPWNGFELTSKFAYKLDGDAYYLAHTSLAGLRVKQNVGTRFDVAAEVREVSVPAIASSRETDFAVEAGYQLGNTARVAVGYNFAGSADPSLMGHPQRKGIYVTLTTLVDRIFGWGKK